ncbi:MAG: (d)CMP kinase [Nitrospinota bacterium]|jgi:cytidylate kinase|nr:(d)CMP kinase [Nitrospinota bacterium]HJM41868.1 (d)CMP kinase [Nitrospinota bacterium]
MSEEAPVVAVDGPAGAGKSTASRRLSIRLGYRYYDTGALYRALAWSAGESGLGREGSDEALTALCRDLVLEFRKTVESGDDWRVWVNGRELTRELKGEEIGRGASIISARPAVRDALLDLQRRQATPPGLVMEGRDVGTVVFPEAAVKFFITADAGERARRRWLEMRRLGREADLESIQREIRERDERDRTREAAPLVPAEDAALIDTTKMNVDEVVENMVDMALQRLSARM